MLPMNSVPQAAQQPLLRNQMDLQTRNPLLWNRRYFDGPLGDSIFTDGFALRIFQGYRGPLIDLALHEKGWAPLEMRLHIPEARYLAEALDNSSRGYFHHDVFRPLTLDCLSSNVSVTQRRRGAVRLTFQPVDITVDIDRGSARKLADSLRSLALECSFQNGRFYLQ